MFESLFLHTLTENIEQKKRAGDDHEKSINQWFHVPFGLQRPSTTLWTWLQSCILLAP